MVSRHGIGWPTQLFSELLIEFVDFFFFLIY